MRLVFFIYLLFFLQNPSIADNDRLQEKLAAQQKIEALAKSLENWEVSSVEILWIDPRTLTNTTVTADVLDRAPQIKIGISNFLGGKAHRDLHFALKNTKISSVGPNLSSDLRWGVKFISHANNRVLVSLYFNAAGQLGYVDNVAVSFKAAGLFRWANENFSRTFAKFSE